MKMRHSVMVEIGVVTKAADAGVLTPIGSLGDSRTLMVCHFESEKPIQSGVSGPSSAALIKPLPTRTTRTLLAEWFDGVVGLTRGIHHEAGFAWAGGVPGARVDLADYPGGVHSVGGSLMVSSNYLRLATHRLADLHEAADGRYIPDTWFYVEGEDESDVGIWPGGMADV